MYIFFQNYPYEPPLYPDCQWTSPGSPAAGKRTRSAQGVSPETAKCRPTRGSSPPFPPRVVQAGTTVYPYVK